MRKTKSLLVLAALLAGHSAHAATIASYEFVTSAAVTTADSNVTASNFAASSGFSAAAWSSSQNFFTREAPISFDVDSGYVGFTVTADSGFTLDLTSLSFNYWATRGAPRSSDYTETVSVRTSVDGFAADLSGTYSLNPFTSNGAVQSASFDLTGASFQGLSSFEVRIYQVINDTVNEFNDISRTDNVLLEGSVSVIPEPSAALLGGLGLLALLRRRRSGH